MSKEKVILYGIVIFVLSAMVYFSYSSQQSAAMKKITETVSSHKTLKTLKTEEERNFETESSVAVQNNDTLSDKSEIFSKTSEKMEAQNEEDDIDDENTPTVERNKLIGGANVEWEEPKPKDPNNKFGEPPPSM